MSLFKNLKSSKHFVAGAFFTLASSFASFSAQATIVQFETNQGNFQVNLYDEATPLTVANFLNYINSGAYTNSVIHRSATNFIIQGGGFVYDAWPVSAIATNPTVKNEPIYSNVRGTIAMAKIANNPDSATNQWFFNLTNNSANLDFQNSGFTVFGQVIGDGMTIIDQIAAVPQYNFGGALTNIPLKDFSEENTPNETNLIIINQITIINNASNTAANLNPPKNQNATSSSRGGGSFELGLICLLGILSLLSIKRKV